MSPKFFERKAKRGRHSGVSNQPASAKDLALIVNQSVHAGDVEKDVAKFAKKATQGFNCESVRIFDVYEGEGLPEGKKEPRAHDVLSCRGPDLERQRGQRRLRGYPEAYCR